MAQDHQAEAYDPLADLESHLELDPAEVHIAAAAVAAAVAGAVVAFAAVAFAAVAFVAVAFAAVAFDVVAAAARGVAKAAVDADLDCFGGTSYHFRDQH